MQHSKYSITSIKHPSFCNKCSPKLSVPITPPSSFTHIFITISHYSFTVKLHKRHKKHNIKLISANYLTINFLIILLRKTIRKLKDAYNNAVNSLPFFEFFVKIHGVFALFLTALLSILELVPPWITTVPPRSILKQDCRAVIQRNTVIVWD